MSGAEMENLRTRDVMLDLDDYAVVPEDATMLDALRALEEAQARLPEGHHRHRAVLVVDGSGEIVGKIGDWEAMSRAGLSGEFVRSVLDSHQLWHQDPGQLRRRAATTTVGEIMRPIGVSIEADAPLADAVHFLVIYQTLSLLVRERGKIVGILRLSDVFRRVCEILQDDGAE